MPGCGRGGGARGERRRPARPGRANRRRDCGGGASGESAFSDLGAHQCRCARSPRRGRASRRAPSLSGCEARSHALRSLKMRASAARMAWGRPERAARRRGESLIELPGSALRGPADRRRTVREHRRALIDRFVRRVSPWCVMKTDASPSTRHNSRRRLDPTPARAAPRARVPRLPRLTSATASPGLATASATASSAASTAAS
jgi:hypothetical protein